MTGTKTHKAFHPDIFVGKTIIVTGASQGIGFACAKSFVESGAHVVLADIDEDKARESMSVFSAPERERAHWKKTDVTSREEVAALVDYAVEKTGRLDVMVSNAGIIHKAPFLELAEEDFDRVLNVNLKGVFLCGQEAAKAMIALNKKVEDQAEQQPENKTDKMLGCIINMSSVNAVMAIPEITPYIVSKGGINQLTKVMALNLAPYGLRVNAVGPGSINTEMLKVAMADEAARKTVLSRTPLGRPGEPEEIASVVQFLSSPAATYMTGQTLYVDGGRMGLNYVVPVKE